MRKLQFINLSSFCLCLPLLPSTKGGKVGKYTILGTITVEKKSRQVIPYLNYSNYSERYP